jgi:hypothetical protein
MLQHYSMAGLQSGRDCYCGGAGVLGIYHYGEATTCDLPCSGDPSIMCGGLWAMSVYSCGEKHSN